jgi:hypothetical protein
MQHFKQHKMHLAAQLVVTPVAFAFFEKISKISFRLQMMAMIREPKARDPM